MISMELNGMIHSRFETQTKMAESMGWGKQRLGKILNGKKMPDLTEVNCIAESLDVPFMSVAQFFLPNKSPNGDK